MSSRPDPLFTKITEVKTI